MIPHVYDFGLKLYSADVLSEWVEVVQAGLEGIFELAKLLDESKGGGFDPFVVAAAAAD